MTLGREAAGRRTLGGAMLAGFLWASTILLSGCVSPRASAVDLVVPDIPATGALYVARRRWHIDLGFAVEDLDLPLATIEQQFPDVRYVFFGFGDRRYLLAKKHDAPVLAAALWPGPAAILVTSLMNTPAQAFGAPSVIALRLSSSELQAVQDFIGRSMSRDAVGGVESLGKGPYPGSLYLAARPRYSGLHTCITWAAEGLRAGNVPVRSRLTVVAGQLWRQLLKVSVNCPRCVNRREGDSHSDKPPS